MTVYKNHIHNIADAGFDILENIYSADETAQIIRVIEAADSSQSAFRKSEDLFAIRQFLNVVPEARRLVFNENMHNLIQHVMGQQYFVVKSIFFDKPPSSNWYVSYHQDLTISVDKKVELENFGPWTHKNNLFAVQPPLPVLENIFTLRIHLDQTDENNGALKVIPGSHKKKIYRPETIDWTKETEFTCRVNKGGVMIMKPLLLHSSGRTKNNQRRRVIHLEFSSLELPSELQWAERSLDSFF